MTTNTPAPSTGAPVFARSFQSAFDFYKVRLSNRDAWFGATMSVLFNALGMSLQIALFRNLPGVSTKPMAVSVLVALMLLAALFIRRKTPSVKWATIIYLVNIASVVTVVFGTNLQFAASGRNWLPFQANKLGCLITAMVAPGFWVGLVGILAHSMSALLLLEFFLTPEIRERVAAAEPLPTLAFALGGTLALIYRFGRIRFEQEVAQIAARDVAIRRLANAFLNIRDLMNTPLQVIECSVHLLRNSNEPPQPILERIDRSLQSLRDINSILTEHEKEIEWQVTVTPDAFPKVNGPSARSADLGDGLGGAEGHASGSPPRKRAS